MSFLTIIRRLKIIYPKLYVVETKQLSVYNSPYKKLKFCFCYCIYQVKLNPSLVDAWLCLGSCIWKKGDLSAAKNCFMSALRKVNIFLEVVPSILFYISEFSSIFLLGRVQIRKYCASSPCLKEVWLKVRMYLYIIRSLSNIFA